MKFSEINAELAPFEALIDTIPDDQIQGINISRILLSKIDELFQELAVKDERIEYLATELFGKNKNKEDPDSDAITDESEQESSDKSEKEARKKLEDAKPPKKSLPKGTAKKTNCKAKGTKGPKM